jgi:hypothetical protein
MQIEKNNVPSGWRPFTMLLYGMPKAGKSTFAASFSPQGTDGSLIIDTENGTDEIDCSRIKVKSLDELNRALNTAWQSSFSTIAVDTIDEIYRWAETQAVMTLNAKMKLYHTAVEEFGYGVGYAVARNILMDIVNRLHVFKSAGKTVLLVSHQRQASADSESEKSRTVDLPGKLSRMIAASVDAIGLVYIVRDHSGELHRRISFKPYDQVDAGCRLRELAGKDVDFNFEAVHREFAPAEEKHRQKPMKKAA